jgi:oxaloacetate decarboxylase gamma subunit
MTKKQGVLGLLGICLLMLVLSAAGLASDFLTRLGLDLDGLLLILCSLLLGLLFLIMLFVIAKEQGWIPERHKKEPAPAAAPSKAPAARPAPAKQQSEETVSVRPGEGK